MSNSLNKISYLMYVYLNPYYFPFDFIDIKASECFFEIEIQRVKEQYPSLFFIYV